MYNVGITIFAFFMRLISPFHKKAKLMVNGHKQTFAILKAKIDRNEKYVWFHAASLGEFEQARPMIESLRKEYPQFKTLLTFFSPSGYEVRKNYPLADVVCYLPFDTKKNVNRFFDLANPHMTIFVKYEFWYNYIHESHKRGIPTYLISSIFRPDQRFFKKNKGKLGNILQFYTHIFVQDENSKKLLNNHGIQKVTVTGDTRIDRVIEIQKQAMELPVIEKFTEGNSVIFIAGSSWEPDEDIFINYFNTHPDLKIIIAPHEIHASHLEEIESKLKRSHIRYSAATEENIKGKDCLIIDSFGLLSSIYRYGDIGYIGGGFGVGIHNLPEAAVYEIPVIFGSNYKKFREAHGLISVGGGFSIQNKSDFNDKMNEFMRSPELRKSVGERSREYIIANAGATQKIIDKIFKK